jgi:hypothetical protein
MFKNISFFRFLFPKKKEITIGSIWYHESDVQHPFGPRDFLYEVADVKEGFVKLFPIYKGKMDKEIFQVKEVRPFYAFYRKIEQ